MMVHNRKPVVYASRTLILVESTHAQILKELFVIVLACDHFDAYINIMSAIGYKLKQITNH